MSFTVLGSTPLISTDPIIVQPTPLMADCPIIAINNYSTFGLDLVLPGGTQDFLLPQQGKYFASDDFYGDSIKLFPVQMLAQGFSGISQVVNIIGYKKGERTPPPGTVYQLGTVVFVANPITTVGGVANQVISDDKAVGFAVVEATVQGDSLSSILLSQEGLLSLGNEAGRPGGLAVLGASSQTFLEGDLSVGSNVSVDASTGEIRGNKLSLPVGSLVSFKFSGPHVSATSPTNYAHGLGQRPDAVFCQTSGGATAVRIVNVNFGNFQPTTFEATCNTAGFQFYAIAYKFS